MKLKSKKGKMPMKMNKSMKKKMPKMMKGGY